MKILVLDIETTGFNEVVDAIVEIGMVLVDTENKKIEKVFSEVVRHSKFDEKKHANSWIFSNSDLKIKDVLKAKDLEYYREKIQELLTKYPMTAFNMKFDTKFMEANNFTLNKTKCLMESSRPYNKNLDRFGNKKIPNVEEIYRQFFPEESFVEAHRGCDDAYHEAKILLKLVEFKQNKLNETANSK